MRIAFLVRSRWIECEFNVRIYVHLCVYLFFSNLSHCCIYLHFTSGVTDVCMLYLARRSAWQFAVVYRMIEHYVLTLYLYIFWCRKLTVLIATYLFPLDKLRLPLSYIAVNVIQWSVYILVCIMLCNVSRAAGGWIRV